MTSAQAHGKAAGCVLVHAGIPNRGHALATLAREVLLARYSSGMVASALTVMCRAVEHVADAHPHPGAVTAVRLDDARVGTVEGGLCNGSSHHVPVAGLCSPHVSEVIANHWKKTMLVDALPLRGQQEATRTRPAATGTSRKPTFRQSLRLITS